MTPRRRERHEDERLARDRRIRARVRGDAGAVAHLRGDHDRNGAGATASRSARSAGSRRSSRCCTWCSRSPPGMLLDRWFRPALAGGGALVALGGVVRLGGETFAWAMAGQVLVAVAQPVVLSACQQARRRVPAGRAARRRDRARLGRQLRRDAARAAARPDARRARPARAAAGARGRARGDPGGGARVRAAPPRPGERRSTPRSRAARHGPCGGLRPMRTLCGLVFLGFGIFVALATWLQTLLAPAGVSETDGRRAAGRDGGRGHRRLRGAAAARRPPARRARLHAHRPCSSACLGCVALAVAPWLGVRRSRSPRWASCCCRRCR